MRTLLIVATVLLSACNRSPIGPSPTPTDPGVRMTVVVWNNVHQPIPNEPITLLLRNGAATEPVSTQTREDGSVTWHVTPGFPYAVQVDGREYFGQINVVGPTKWYAILTSRR